MAVPSSVDPEQRDAARRSIRHAITVRVTVAAACLALLWALALAAALGLALAGHSLAHNHRILIEYGLLAVAGFTVIAAAVLALRSFGRRLSREVSGLATAAQRLASWPLEPTAPEPDGQRRDRARDFDGIAAAVEPTTTEVARAAAAITVLRQRAAAATASEAGLRDGLRQVFVSLAKRNQALLHRQLRLIDTLEQKASDPAALADLFLLDHLTTRMRRHAESLAVLSGAAPGRFWREPVPVIDVIRAAIAEVEDYRRVSVLTAAEDAVVGPAVADMIHLLAELIENATLYSPSGTQVEIRAGRVANGFAVEIHDRGLGIEPEQLREINEQLARPPDFDLADADRLGLFVGAKLAARHGVRVSLRRSPYGGTSAIALMPNSIVTPDTFSESGLRPGTGDQPGGIQPGARPVPARIARPDLSGAAALGLTGRRAAQPLHGDAPVGPPDSPAAAAAPGTPGVPATPGSAAGGSDPATAGPDDLPGAGPPGPAEPGALATSAGLPRRTRQASMSPHLRDRPAAGTAGHLPGTARPPAAPVTRTPERARDLAASVQHAWRRGREATPPGDDPATEVPAAEPDHPETPDAEEA